MPDLMRITELTSTKELAAILLNASSHTSHIHSDPTKTPRTIQVFELKGNPKLVISDEVLLRVIKWHTLHKHLEWSGKLLYTKSNYDFRNPDDIKCTAIDFIPWDLGDAITTTCQYSNPDVSVAIEEYIPDVYDDYRLEDESLQIQNGLIHSHHHMSTFFSDTDQPTLIEKSRAFTYGAYLSLIVNHDTVWSKASNKWIARIAWHTTQDKKTGKWILRAGTDIVGVCNAPVCVWMECEVLFNFEVDTSDVDRQRYLQLYPIFIEKYFQSVTISSEFMDIFYSVFTDNIMSKWNNKTFTNWISSYADIDEWYTDYFDSAINATIEAGIMPFKGFTDIEYPIEWVQRKIYASHIRDLKTMTNVELAKTIANICKKDKIKS